MLRSTRGERVPAVARDGALERGDLEIVLDVDRHRVDRRIAGEALMFVDELHVD